MKRRLLQLLIALVAVLSCLLGVDACLYHIDPAGVVRYTQDYNQLQSHALPAPFGLVYQPGNYRFNRFKVSIGLDGFRSVPANRGGMCRIVFVGDSMTFGMSSDFSFVDLLAPDIDANVTNAGIPGFNVENIRQEVEFLEADAYIWLVFPNDDQPRLGWSLPTGGMPPALVMYQDWWIANWTWDDSLIRFKQNAAPILARDDVRAFALDFGDTPFMNLVQQEFPQVALIPMYSTYVSAYDRHPDAAGTRQIADAMHDQVVDFVERRCAQVTR